MTQTLLEKHEALVMEIANVYLGNMARELGIKYRDSIYHIKPRLSDSQHALLKAKYKISSTEYSKLYEEFDKMEPTSHMQQAMQAFTASGGQVDIEPSYDENTSRLEVSVQFSIKDRTLDRIEGFSPLEDVILKLNAMIQIDQMLSNADPDDQASF